MYTSKIKDLPEDMRPQEKLLKHGPTYLSNGELIALIIRTGSKKKSSIAIANEVIQLGFSKSNVIKEDDFYGLRFLLKATPEELKSVKGIGDSKAAMIMAAVELGRRIGRGSSLPKEKITDTSKLPGIVMDEMRYYDKEYFKIAILNTKKELEYLETISIGSLDKTIVEPREVFHTAISRNAHTIILLHNHPSGDPEPSRQDRAITDRLVSLGDMLGIPVIDHIIIGDGRYFSFLSEGIL